MVIANKRETLILFLGDLMIFFGCIYLALFLRHLELPNNHLFLSHLFPFGIMIAFWVSIFYVAGLYDKQTLFLRSRLPQILLNAYAVNIFFAVLFFYFIPQFGIEPKTNLFIYSILTLVFVFTWRVFGYWFFSSSIKQNALLIGGGEETKELFYEINSNKRYSIKFTEMFSPEDIDVPGFESRLLNLIKENKVSTIVLDTHNPKVGKLLPSLYNLIFSNVRFVDFYKVYEDTFDRIPLSILFYDWFLENISQKTNAGYAFLKRGMDFVLALFVGIISLVFYPFVALAIKIEDGGPVFISQERIGLNNRIIKVYKLRTMSRNDASSDKWSKEGGNKVTKVGSFLRRTSIDELPQVWNILKGELSFIGPRSDIAGLGLRLAKEIPHYNVRNLITPGISGWAQVNQVYSPGNISPQSVDETKIRLSYDLFYLKNRSFLIDLRIVVKTFKALISRLSV